jgi:hypothetical protein
MYEMSYWSAQLCTIFLHNKITCQQHKKKLEMGLVVSHTERILTSMCETQGWMAITEKINTQREQQKRKRLTPHTEEEFSKKYS